MDILKAKKEDFLKILKEGPKVTPMTRYQSVVIVPNGSVHESGYECLSFVFLDAKNEVAGVADGYSDVLSLDGIGGYGDWSAGARLPMTVPPKGWQMDCLPGSGYLRLWTDGELYIKSSMILSEFEVYSTGKKRGGS